MVVSLLERHELFHSNDLDYVRDSVARVLCPHGLDVSGRGQRLDARMRSRRLDNVVMNYIDYGADVSIDPGELGTFFVVMIPVRGRARIRSGREEIESVPGLASVPDPTKPLRMRWSADCAQLIVRIERPTLEAHLHDLVGFPHHNRLTFGLGMDLTRGFGRAWWRFVQFIASEFDHDDTLLNHDHMHPAAVEAYLMTGLLRAQPSNIDLRNTEPEYPIARRAVSTVRDLIHAHPEWELTAPRLAREVGVTTRTLQKWFRNDLDCTPIEYLRDIRLERIHATLQAARPDEVTVYEVAARWGFAHHGHFATAYRKRFGRRPKETLDG